MAGQQETGCLIGDKKRQPSVICIAGQRLQGKRRANNCMEAERGAIPPSERDSGSKNGRKSRIWFRLSAPAAHAERYLMKPSKIRLG
jgi:hypothetical protein